MTDLTEERINKMTREERRQVIIDQAKTKGVNQNEMAVLVSALDDTDGLNLTCHIKPKGLSTHQVKGYISSLAKKGIFKCEGGENNYPDFVDFPIELANGSRYILTQDDDYWIEVVE